MKKFSVLDGEVSFTQSQLEFVRLRGSFQELKRELSTAANRQLAQTVSDVDKLPQILTALVSIYLQRASDLAVESLCQRDIYDIDESSFQQELVSNVERAGILEPLLEIGTVVLEIDDIRGSGGIGLMGGGFGIEGAARGIAVAGAVNLLTSALSGAAASARREAQRQATTAILKQTDQIPLIVGALDRMVDSALNQTAHCIVDRAPSTLDFPTAVEVERATSLITNLAKGRVPTERAKSVTLQALQQNPYDPAVHVLMASEFPDAGDAAALSHFLGIDVREHAGKDEVKAVVGSAAQSLSYWADELLSIFRRFPSKHLHVEPHIPQRKLSGARSEYFKQGVGYPEGMSAFRLLDVGRPLALIDTTVFGGGGHGITFSSNGFALNGTAEEPRGLQWVALKHLEPNLERTFFGVRLFGGEIQLSGLDISKQTFFDMMFAIREQLAQRDWKT